MKNNFLFIALASILLWSCEQPLSKVIERPDYGLQNSQTLEIGKVELTDTSTILYIDAYFTPNYWIRVDSATYIQANGEKYIITGSKDIALNEYHWMPESGEDNFILYFPPLPKGTKSFDFIESDCDDCFKIWDVDLTGKKKKGYKSNLPQDLINFQIDKNLSLGEPELKMGKTQVKLFLHGWKPGYSASPELMVSNFFTREYEEIPGKLIKDGEYIFDCELYATASCYLRLGNYIPLLLAPGENAEIHLDLEAQSRRISRYHQQPDLKYVGFRGKYAQINTERFTESEALKELNCNLDEDYSLLDLTAEEYASRLISIYKEQVKKIDNADLSVCMRQLQKENFKTTIVDHMLMSDYFLPSLYRKQNNLNYNDPIDYKAPKLTDKEFLLLKELNLNDPMWIYSSSFMYSGTELAGGVSSDELLNEITGTTTGLLQDIRKSAPALALSSSQEELKPELKEALQSTSTSYYTEVYNALVEKAKREYEEAMKQGGFKILTTPNVANEKILEAIIAQYKGKPVFVDFWATWCGPCVGAMKTIKPIKPEMAEKGVVSIYITGASSPHAKWVGMLPEIGGLHYYLTAEQWKVVGDKYNIQGIPTYMIFDKQGKKSFETSGYPGNERVLEELGKVW